MESTMTFTATGDSFITRRIPNKQSDAFTSLVSLLNQAEVKFTNLEVTTHRFEGHPSAQSGGTWAVADPSVLKDIKQYGFNLIAWANNHTLDYSYGGLEATARYLNEHGFIHAGVGSNLAEASAPRYIDCPSGRVALIAVTSTFHESWTAGEQRRDMSGRPGVNPLRYTTTYTASREQMAQLKSIAETTGINDAHDLAVKEGFAVQANDQNALTFGGHRFVVGPRSRTVTRPEQRDLDRTMTTIAEAKRQADYVIVSVHSHEMRGQHKHEPADFLKDFSRSCIDHGAHAVIGHGPHILRGIEIYQKRPIFYSLGNFIFQNDTVQKLPSDFYEKYGLGHNHNVADALDTRSDNGTKGLGVNPDVWESVIPLWEMQHGELTALTLYPISLGFELPRYRKGWPELSNDTAVLERLNRLSAPFGTEINVADGIGYVRW